MALTDLEPRFITASLSSSPVEVAGPRRVRYSSECPSMWPNFVNTGICFVGRPCTRGEVEAVEIDLAIHEEFGSHVALAPVGQP